MLPPNRSRPSRGRRAALSFDPLEGRALLSGATLAGLPRPEVAALTPIVSARAIRFDPAAVAAIRNALMGRGPGSEFATLLRGQVRNLGSVVSTFVRGRNEFTTNGVAIKIPQWNPLYTGQHFDHLTATAAGVVLQRDGQLQLGAIMRGLFDEAVPSQVVFGIDRGSGGARGPLFASRPGITPDALVTVTVGPNGVGNSAAITDLTTGATTPIDPSKVIVEGATVRVFVDQSALPSKGQPISRYRFAAWTRNGTSGGIETVGSFIPEQKMIPIGVLPRRR